LGGFKAQGKTAEAALTLLENALFLEEAGCFGLVLEAIPSRVASFISHKLKIPTIGIGAGNECDGQVLVTNDLMGLFDKFTPKFVKQYSALHQEINKALKNYRDEVSQGEFPTREHSFLISDQEWEIFLDQAGDS
jgi:3-methyl-2-oxobutanoate hydroxymethyltransferase